MKAQTIKGFLVAAVFAAPAVLLAVDSDGDGLDDSVETDTGSYVSPTDTGTDPNNPDSDGDGAGDWYEVAASFTDPNVAGDKPNVPYPLPAPDSTPPATNKPVKVYILTGQSNMVGQGNLSPQGTPGTLLTITRDEGKFPYLLDGAGWSVRNDVAYRGVLSSIDDAMLTPGQSGSATVIGPEMGFGHVMGYFHEEPVLLIKSSVGGRALGWDFLPPGSVQYPYGPNTYAGYGDSPASWSTGSTPVPVQNYGGYQYDQCFLDETNWHPNSTFGPVENVTDILDNFATEYPQWADQGFEIAGFAWWQGWNDGLSYTAAYAYRYEQNMAQFIREIRDYYEGRYPGKIRTDAPFVLATCAFNGWDAAYTNQYPTRAAVINAQLAVGDPAQYSEFSNNVNTVEARGYWRDASVSPAGAGYHYNRNAETFMLVGDALARGMIELIELIEPDLTAPAITNSVPADDATGVSAVSNLVQTFTEPIALGTGNITITNMTAATQWTIPVTDASQVSVAGADLTIHPTANLDDNTSYAVLIDATAVKDESDNFFPGITNVTTWNFTTAPPDTTPPTPTTMTWASVPTATSSSAIAMTATTASDPSGVEYSFECTAGGGHDSGWQDSLSYTDTGLSANTEYAYRVRARDKSAAQNATGYSSEESATTAVDWYALPFYETFEDLTPGDLDGLHGWSAMNAVVQGDVTFGGSMYAGAITNDAGFLAHTFSNSNNRVWIDSRLQVKHSETPPTPMPDVTAALYVSTNSQVMVYDGSNAVPCGATAAEGEWVRFTIFNDYPSATWVLYVNEVRAGRFGFYSSDLNSFSEFVLKGGPTVVDNIAITLDQPSMKQTSSLLLIR